MNQLNAKIKNVSYFRVLMEDKNFMSNENFKINTYIIQWNFRSHFKMKLWRKYCHHTTLHGFQYFSKKNLCLAEKVFWIIILISALIASSFSLKKLLNEIDKNPTIMYQSETPISITQIPFPALTYCPGVKPKEQIPNITRVEYLLKNVQNITEEEYEIIMNCE